MEINLEDLFKQIAYMNMRKKVLSSINEALKLIHTEEIEIIGERVIKHDPKDCVFAIKQIEKIMEKYNKGRYA